MSNPSARASYKPKGQEASINPPIAPYGIKVTNDQGSLIALFQGMAYRKEKNWKRFKGTR